MITTTGEFTRSRDIGQTYLRSVGIAAVFLGVLAATATGVAAADPPPSGGSSPSASVLQAGNVVATYRLVLHAKQSPVTTALALATAMVGLFGFAYVESYLRTLRRDANRPTAVVGLAASSAVLAVAVVAAPSVLSGHQPTVATLVSCSVLAAALGLAAARLGVGS